MIVPNAVLSVRHARLDELVELLNTQHAALLDVVVPASRLTARNGNLLVEGIGEPVLTPDGVTPSQTLLRPTPVADGGLADKLGIPTAYLRTLRGQRLDLYDANINGWLIEEPVRRFLIRGLHDRSGGAGIARAVLSDSYRFVDNLDVLMAVLDGVRAAGADIDVVGCDLTERRMYVRIRSTTVAAHAPELLRDYVSPFSGARGADNPVVFAGFVITNSETGHGSFSLTPQITVQICNNGMTITRDAMREVHLGARLTEGVVAWRADTQRALVDLIGKQTRDAVATFLTRDYLTTTIDTITRDARVPLRDPQATLEHVGRQLRYSADQQTAILSHFIQGADITSGGLLHAVTSTAQTLADADDAYQLERSGLRAMALAAAHA